MATTTTTGKKGYLKMQISMPPDIDQDIRKHVHKKGDYSKFVVDAVKEKLKELQESESASISVN